jgi:hypothetical protein
VRLIENVKTSNVLLIHALRKSANRDVGVCERLFVMHYVETLVSLEKLTFISDGFPDKSIALISFNAFEAAEFILWRIYLVVKA